MVLQITPWERDALQLLAAGVADDEIAAVLRISEPAVNSYLACLFEKLGVTSRNEAVVAATRRGLVAIHARNARNHVSENRPTDRRSAGHR